MDEVADLLTAWEIPELIPTFAKNGITVTSLSALNVEVIKELIPLIGPRSLFIRSWKVWLKTVNEENAIICENKEEVDFSSCNISLSVNLLQLLKENFEATCLVQYVGKSLPNENARNLLALVIAKNIMKVNKNSAITGFVYSKWCRDIKVLFPGERTTTYYIPACVTALGNTIQARGKLVSQLLNTRRNYQKFGVLDKRVPSPGSSHSQGNATTSEPICLEDDTRILESLMWLKHSSSPWSLVQSKWTENFKSRKIYLKDPERSIEEYIKKYPAFQKPEGYTLAGLRWLVNKTVDSHYKNLTNIKGTIIRQRYHAEHPFDVWSKSVGSVGCFQQVLSLDADNSDITKALTQEAAMQLHILETDDGSGPYLLQMLWGRMISAVIYRKQKGVTQDQLRPVFELMGKLRGPQRLPRICETYQKEPLTFV